MIVGTFLSFSITFYKTKKTAVLTNNGFFLFNKLKTRNRALQLPSLAQRTNVLQIYVLKPLLQTCTQAP